MQAASPLETATPTFRRKSFNSAIMVGRTDESQSLREYPFTAFHWRGEWWMREITIISCQVCEVSWEQGTTAADDPSKSSGSFSELWKTAVEGQRRKLVHVRFVVRGGTFELRKKENIASIFKTDFAAASLFFMSLVDVVPLFEWRLLMVQKGSVIKASICRFTRYGRDHWRPVWFPKAWVSKQTSLRVCLYENLHC